MGAAVVSVRLYAGKIARVALTVHPLLVVAPYAYAIADHYRYWVPLLCAFALVSITD